MRIQLIALCCVLIRLAVSAQLPCYGVDGTALPCYPPYEDVAAGLVPASTSTCVSSGPACEGCSPCDERVSPQSHPPSLTTDGSSDTYWQSAKVTSGGSVNLTYDLGGFYEVDNVSLEFVGPVPNVTTLLLESTDAGQPSVTLLSYSPALCRGKPTCAPVTTRLLPNSHQIIAFALPKDVVKTAESVRLRLYPITDYVAIANVNIAGRCACNGHASSCAREGGTPVCNCSHNSEGSRCQTCSNGYGKQHWSYNGGPAARAYICQACPSCYQTVEHYQNTTLAVFQRFVSRMNATLSTVDTLAELVRYQQLIRTLLLRTQLATSELQALHGKLSDSATLYTSLEEKTAASETSILTINRDATILSSTVATQSELLIKLANVTDTLEALVGATASQIQLASELLNATERAYLELEALTYDADVISKDQVIQAQVVLGNAKKALSLASEAFRLSQLAITLQNTTAASFAALEAGDLIKLNELYLEAKSYFESIQKNAPVIANESQSILEQTNDLHGPEFHLDIQYLAIWVENLANKSQTLRNAAANLTWKALEDEAAYSRLNVTAHALLERSSGLRTWATVLAGKAADAFRTANTSVQETQDILHQALDLLNQLNTTLQKLVDFKSKLDGLVEAIRTAQKQSNLVLGVATQANHTLVQVAAVVEAAVQRNSEATVLLTQAYTVISRANVTSSITSDSTEALKKQTNSLANATSVLRTELEGLGRRAAMDSASIVNASLSVNLSSSRTLDFRNRIVATNRTVFELKAKLNSIYPVPPSLLLSMNATLNRLELEAIQNQALINMTQQLITQLEASAKQLEDKYVTLQQQRDLLQHILNNLSNLDCRKQYSGT